MNATILKCLETILNPLLRVCLRNSVKLQELVEIIKTELVHVAKEELVRGGEPVSASRLSVMTGVHRKDVARFLETPNEAKENRNLTQRIISTWQQDSRFTTDGGKARTLSFEGANSEFAELVRSVSADLNTYTILFELERIGAVEKSSRGLRLASRIYNPKGNPQEGYRLLADDTADLITAVEANIRAEHVPHMHIKTEFDNIAPEDIETIRQWCFDEGSLFHERARNYLSRFDRDSNPDHKSKDNGVRIAIGSFSLIDDPKTRAI